MGKSAPSQPTPPSPAAVGAANDQTALWNASLANVNQQTPLGTETFQLTQGDPTGQNQNAPAPQYTETTTYNQPIQSLINTTEGNMNALANTSSGLLGRIQQQASQPINYGNFTPMPASGDLADMQKTSFNAQMNQLQPLFQQQNESENSQLLNQGITPGSEAWNNGWYTTNAGQNNAAQQALENAQNYASGMDQTALADRQQQIAEAYQQQNAPLNQYSALMGQAQVSTPTFSAAPSSGNPAATVAPGGNALEQNYAQQMQNYNAQVAAQNAQMQGLFGLGGSALTALLP